MTIRRLPAVPGDRTGPEQIRSCARPRTQNAAGNSSLNQAEPDPVSGAWFSGWAQEDQLKGGTALEISVTSTIAYTAIPATALALLAWGMSRRRTKAPK